MKKKGFTLIEILVVTSIIGLLSSTLVPKVGNAIKKTNETMDQVNQNKQYACEELGLDDFCDSSAGGGAAGDGFVCTENGVFPHGIDITVCRDGNSITIQDRNLGATTTGAGKNAPNTSYGNYYQWGDNTLHTEADWSSRNIQPDDAWGGGSDNNGLVYPVLNQNARKGPCDVGYHVPSQGEWYALMDIRAGIEVNGRIEDRVSQFYTDLQIPFAGSRQSYKGLFADQGSIAYLWSSSPRVKTNSEDALILSMLSYGAYANPTYSRSYGFPVRCFKN